ncbi:hypothetical protein SDC9_201340 [bioreactor metagenome]|uniref:Uncharacterized protein n=1 Tax=bioreactor metagenome TaxID=1076179 RepID=A0A645IRE3_9ZZZZ
MPPVMRAVFEALLSATAVLMPIAVPPIAAETTLALETALLSVMAAVIRLYLAAMTRTLSALMIYPVKSSSA